MRKQLASSDQFPKMSAVILVTPRYALLQYFLTAAMRPGVEALQARSCSRGGRSAPPLSRAARRRRAAAIALSAADSQSVLALTLPHSHSYPASSLFFPHQLFLSPSSHLPLPPPSSPPLLFLSYPSFFFYHLYFPHSSPSFSLPFPSPPILSSISLFPYTSSFLSFLFSIYLSSYIPLLLSSLIFSLSSYSYFFLSSSSFFALCASQRIINSRSSIGCSCCLDSADVCYRLC